MMMMIELDIKVFHRERENTHEIYFYVFFSLKLILRIYFKNIDIFIYLIVVIVFLAGNSPSSVKYTAYRKKSLGN